MKTQAWVSRLPKENAPDDDTLAPECFEPVKTPEYPRWKPRSGGLWTSTYLGVLGSDWIRWCRSESFYCNGNGDEGFRVWLLEPDRDARIYEIDSYADLERLVEGYPQHPEDELADLHLGVFTQPAWGEVAADYDAIHLTEEGQWATRMTHPLSLYGWDCESTLWLRWAFASWRDLGVIRPLDEVPLWSRWTSGQAELRRHRRSRRVRS